MGACLVGDDGHIETAVGGVDSRDDANDDDDWPPHRADHSLEQITCTPTLTGVRDDASTVSVMGLRRETSVLS